jgi:hypothetical protein
MLPRHFVTTIRKSKSRLTTFEFCTVERGAFERWGDFEKYGQQVIKRLSLLAEIFFSNYYLTSRNRTLGW